MDTKGPWNRDAVYRMLKFATEHRDEWAGGVDGPLSFPTESDADLVCAAKELRDVCLEVVNNCHVYYTESVDIDSYTTEMIWAAIHKAKGTPP